MADDLRRWLAGEPIQRPVGNAERLWRLSRRNSMVAGLIAAVTITLWAGTVVSSFFAVRAYAAAKRADDKAAEVRRNLYVSHMHLAQAA